MNITVRHSERAQNLSCEASLGLALISGVNEKELQESIASIADLQGNAFKPSEAALRRIQAFDRFFSDNGFRSPLAHQLEMVRKKGLPGGSAPVQALLLAEITTGLLMGAQNADAIEGELIYDVSAGSESFQGMRAMVTCHEGEMVLRDNKGIIASLFQGPDQRTRLTKETQNIIFFVFAVPGIETHEIQQGLETIRTIFQTASSRFSGQIISASRPVKAF